MEKLLKKWTTDLQITVYTVLSMSPSILHSAHKPKAKMELENGYGGWLCCLKRLTSCAKLWAVTVVLIGVLDAIDPRKLLVCLSIGTESLAAALDTLCRPVVTGSKSGHACTLLRMAVYVKFT